MPHKYQMDIPKFFELKLKTKWSHSMRYDVIINVKYERVEHEYPKEVFKSIFIFCNGKDQYQVMADQYKDSYGLDKLINSNDKSKYSNVKKFANDANNFSKQIENQFYEKEVDGWGIGNNQDCSVMEITDNFYNENHNKKTMTTNSNNKKSKIGKNLSKKNSDSKAQINSGASNDELDNF